MAIGGNEASIDQDKSKSDAPRTEPSEDDLWAAYQQLCSGYRAIDDFRAKLLGFLPLATGTGIFLLVNNLSGEMKEFLGPIGVFGFVITLGLFSYEIHGINKCHHLIKAGKEIEGLLHVDGHFRKLPGPVAGFINEPFAAGLIYPAVLAAWVYFALVFPFPQGALYLAILVFIVGCAGSLIYDYRLRKKG